MDVLQQLIELISRHAPSDGTHATPIDGVSLVRSGTPTLPMPVVYVPTLCLIVQGRKQVVASATSYVYDAATYLVASVDIPVMGSVIEASEAAFGLPPAKDAGRLRRDAPTVEVQPTTE